MALYENEREPVRIAALAREVFDVTGAGDTLIATLAVAIATGCPLDSAAALALCTNSVSSAEKAVSIFYRW